MSRHADENMNKTPTVISPWNPFTQKSTKRFFALSPTPPSCIAVESIDGIGPIDGGGPSSDVFWRLKPPYSTPITSVLLLEQTLALPYPTVNLRDRSSTDLLDATVVAAFATRRLRHVPHALELALCLGEICKLCVVSLSLFFWKTTTHKWG